MTSSTDKLERALGLVEDSEEYSSEPSFEVMQVPVRKENVPALSTEKVEQNKADDYSYARDTMTHLMTQGSEALTGLLTLAAEGPSARNYEVISTLIKTVSEVSKDLIDLDDKMTPKDSGGKSGQSAQTINNNQFNMSHADAIEAARVINGDSK